MSVKSNSTQAPVVNNFYAILVNGDVRRINLTQDLSGAISQTFTNAGAVFENDELEQVIFDGNYIIDEGEILYVEMKLPDKVLEAATNSIGIPVLNLKTETIKTLFWVDNNTFYFQNFDSRKLLTNRNIILYSDNTYTALKNDAFIVDNVVHATHKNNKLLFFSFANVNKIFSLADFYREATNKELEEFSVHKFISVSDTDWFTENSNTVIRKQVTLLQKSGTLNHANPKAIIKDAKGFNLKIELQGKKIVFPKDIKQCREILIFLNEQFYTGLITGTKYRTNSKRAVQISKPG